MSLLPYSLLGTLRVRVWCGVAAFWHFSASYVKPEYILLPLWSDIAFGRVKLHTRPCTDVGEKSAGIVGRFCETPMKRLWHLTQTPHNLNPVWLGRRVCQ